MNAPYIPSPATSPFADLLARCWQNRFKVTAAFVAIMSATAAFTAFSEPTYRSTAQLNVRIGRHSATLDPTITTGQFVAVADPREAEINAVADLIVSRGILEAVVADIGENVIRNKKEGATGIGDKLSFLNAANLNPFRVYSTQDDAVKKLTKKLKVNTTRNSSIIDIFCEANSPELAHNILDSLIKHVRERHNQINQTAGSHEYFLEEMKTSKQHLTELENRREDLKNRTEVSDLQTQREKLLTRIRFLQDSIDDTKASLSAIETEVSVRSKMLTTLPASIVTEETSGEVNSVQDKMREELFRLETREKELRSKFTDESIYVRQIRDQISQARAVIEAEEVTNKVTRGVFKPNEEMQIALNNVRAQRDALQARLEPLQEQLAAEKAKLQVINENEKEFVSLDREIRLAETQFLDFHKAYQQTLVDQSMEAQKITNINLLQPPTLTLTPHSPQPLVNMAFGLGASLLSMLGIASASKRGGQTGGAAPTTTTVIPSRPVSEELRSASTSVAATADSVAGDVASADPLEDLVEPAPRRPLPR